MFTNSDKEIARDIIEVRGIGLMRRSDLIMLSFFAGSLVIMIPLNLFFLFLKEPVI